MQISINCPTYKRPGRIKTFDFIPTCKAWLAESEFENYAKNNPVENLVKVPDNIQGNLCRIRNYIIKKCFENGDDAVVIVDDDLNYIGYHENKEKIPLKTEEIAQFFEKYSIMAQDLGAKFWGINVSNDKQNYREYSPFSFHSYIGGPVQVFLKGNEVFYDERLFLKEDYDMTIAQCNKYRKVLRVNKFFYMAKQSEQAGGCAVQRNYSVEKEQFDLLQKKWGAEIVRRDPSPDKSHASTKTRRVVDYNPVIHIPIK
jgi:hypothetical protein